MRCSARSLHEKVRDRVWDSRCPPPAGLPRWPRHEAEAMGIEVAEIDDVDVHEINLTRGSLTRRARNCIASSALTPYLCGSASSTPVKRNGDGVAADIR